MFQVKARILSNTQVAPDCFRISLRAPSIAKKAKPGQFIQVRCSNGDSPLLRRPFSIHKVSHQLPANGIEVLYKVIGKGTELLSGRGVGEELDIIGPLGNGFSAPGPGVRTVILVGGGVGISPLMFLAQKLITAQSSRQGRGSSKVAKLPPGAGGKAQSKKNLIVLLGAKNKEQILCAEDFKKLGAQVKIATEDGSLGFKGTAIALLSDLLSNIDSELSTVYASGPKAMLKEVARICRKEDMSGELSLEEVIACGFGVCLGCAVRTKEGYKLVCKDGPVFNHAQLLWD